jgi:hypothetical protein
MTKHTTLEIETLRSMLEYDPDTGLFRRKTTGAHALHTMRANGYLWGTVGGKRILAHRAAWAITHGYWPKMVDHINRDRSDNRIANLREATPLENSHNSAVFRGDRAYVSQLKRAGRWSLRFQGEYVGCFATEQDALDAAQQIRAGNSAAIPAPRKNRPRTKLVNYCVKRPARKAPNFP